LARRNRLTSAQRKKLNNIRKVSSDYLYYTLQYKKQISVRIAKSLFSVMPRFSHSSVNSLRTSMVFSRWLIQFHMRKAPVELYGNAGFAYIGVDVDSGNQQMKRAAFAAIDDKLSPEDADTRMSKLGVFMIISSEDIDTAEILPLYYTRRQIEQVFDLGKNNADILSPRVQSEDTFRGHLMVTFLATVLLQKLQRGILTKRKKKDKINPEGALFALKNQKREVYANEIVPQEAVKSINDVYKLFQINCPAAIPIKML
jgi:hypothetical protein